MRKSCLPLLVLIAGCGHSETFVQVSGAPSTPLTHEVSQEVKWLVIEPSEYRCEAMSETARAAVPPPPPVFAEESSTPRVRAVCPPGQVPYYRQPALPDRSGGVGPAAGTYWYAGVMKPTESYNQSGVGARVLINNPAVYDQNDMVTGQMSIVRGNNYHLVEIGLRKFWDSFPRLMISQWSYGQFKDSTGFVRIHATYAPGMPLTGYYGAAIRHYIRYSNGNWWVWFNDAWVGYFPGSIWNNEFSSGEMAHFYGEVYSAQSRIPPLTDMGNGLFASDPAAAAMSEMCMHSAGNDCYVLVNAWRSVTNASYYSLLYSDGNYMRYGGNGGG